MTAGSPFPQFSNYQVDGNPASGFTTNDNQPTVSVDVNSATPIDASSIILAIDGNTIAGPTVTPIAQGVNVSGSPSSPLYDGSHTISITAANDDSVGNGGSGSNLNLIDSDSSVNFMVDTSNSTPSQNNPSNGQTLPSNIPNTNGFVPVCTTSGPSGICGMTVSGPPGFQSSTITFSIAQSSVAFPTIYPISLTGNPATSSGTWTICCQTCAGNTTCSTVTVSTQSWTYTFTASGIYNDIEAGPTSPSALYVPWKYYTSAENCFFGTPNCCLSITTAGNCAAGGGASAYREIDFNPPVQSKSYSIVNVSSNTVVWLGVELGLVDKSESISFINNASEDVSLTVPQVPGQYYQAGNSVSLPAGPSIGTINSSYGAMSMNPVSPTLAMASQWTQQLLTAPPNGTFFQLIDSATGGGVVFTSTAALTISYPDGVPPTDTTTAMIYGWNGTEWENASISSQTVSVSGSSITVSGNLLAAYETYGVFFNTQDSSAPVTTYSIQGSSYSFDGTTYYSTSTYAVLVATDPVVNGFQSGVETTYYRLDGTLPPGTFSVYTSSVPLSLGPHVFEYYSVDWAGNVEATSSTTFVVTAGTLFKDTAAYTTAGKFLSGLVSYGNQAEVQSQAQNDYTLLATGQSGTPLMATTNIGNTGIGTYLPVAPVDIQGTGSSGDIALQLRSGNSTSTSSVQAAFCYNGTNTMCDALTTQHNSGSDAGNRMDFWLWNSGVSTSTIGNMDVLSLQAITALSGQGAVHVMPVGNANVELEVSDGNCTGCGTIHRIAAGAPSTRERKTDIRYLSERDREQAYSDVMSLKHASYRYKTLGKDGLLHPDPKQPMREGLIYEDSPKSIQGSNKSIVLDDRVENLELALQEDMKKLELLQKQLRELEGTGP